MKKIPIRLNVEGVKPEINSFETVESHAASATDKAQMNSKIEIFNQVGLTKGSLGLNNQIKKNSISYLQSRKMSY